MRHGIVALLISALVVLVSLGVFSAASATTEPPKAESAIVSCTDVVIGQQIRIKCTAAGVVVLNTTVNLPQVEVTVPGAPVTVRVPLPGDTETVRVPGPTQTVTVQVPVPGGTKTETVVVPGETTTVTTPPRPNETVTATQPGQTTTVSPSETPSRQAPTDPGTIVPEPEDDDTVVTIPGVNLNPAEAVGLGTVAIAAIAFLILLGMYAGYYMGYKDSDKAEASFYRSLLGK